MMTVSIKTITNCSQMINGSFFTFVPLNHFILFISPHLLIVLVHFNFSVHDDGRLFLAIKCFRLNKICTFTSTYFSSWLLLRGLLSDKHEERL